MSEETPARPEAAPPAPPQWSPDGHYWWNGTTWVARSQLPMVAAQAQPGAPGSLQWGAGLLVAQGGLICLVQLLLVVNAITEYGIAGSIPARVLLLALGIADLVFGVALYRRRYWGWIGAVMTQVLAAGVGLFLLGLGPVLFAVIVLALLTRPSARSWLSPTRR